MNVYIRDYSGNLRHTSFGCNNNVTTKLHFQLLIKYKEHTKILIYFLTRVVS